ncbi:MAG: AAA family ATPase, partial [Aigarchaeota archaeon]|nr:AAA family ATPase [Aigarchaeota archaeon]
MTSLEDLLNIRKMVVSISGKGGSGKTTLCALLLKALLQNADRSILVVDADPATNLHEVLGVRIGKTVGMVASELREKIDRGAVPLGQSKADLLETWVFSTLV